MSHPSMCNGAQPVLPGALASSICEGVRRSRAHGSFEETVDTTYDQTRAGYFNIGLPTTVSNANGTIEMDYDAEGRETRRNWTIGGTAYTPQTSTYFPEGLMSAITYPDGTAVGTGAAPWSYDAAGRLSAIPGLITSATYNARHQTKSISYANGLTTNFTYNDQRGWVTEIETVNGSGATIYRKSYTRNQIGQITSTDSDRALQRWIYTYDDLGRLTNADNLGDNALDQSWTYDDAGNMSFNSALGTYTYPIPTGPRPHAPLTVGGQVFIYDSAGNMTVGLEGRSIAYYGSNRPEQVTWRGQSSSYAYGPDGERISKTSGADTTRYLGDTELTPEGRYIVHPHADVRLVDGLASYEHRDHLASVSVMTDEAGFLISTRDYTPYGDAEGREWMALGALQCLDQLLYRYAFSVRGMSIRLFSRFRAY